MQEFQLPDFQINVTQSMKLGTKMYLHYINRDFQYYYIRIRNHYYNTSKSFDPDSIHDLRVEIKRLRAFFRLIEALNPDFKYRKNFKAIRRLFKAAGNLRDIHVQQALACEWETKFDIRLDDYAELLQQKEIEAKTELADFMKNYNIKALKQKGSKIQSLLSNLPVTEAQKKANYQLTTMVTELRHIYKEAEQHPKKLHLLRTQTKQIRYTFDILLRCLPNVNYPRTTSTRLKQLHHILGLWHDNIIAIELLNKFHNDGRNQIPPNQDYFSRLKQAIHYEQKQHLRNYKKAWENLLTQIVKQ